MDSCSSGITTIEHVIVIRAVKVPKMKFRRPKIKFQFSSVCFMFHFWTYRGDEQTYRETYRDWCLVVGWLVGWVIVQAT
jgi:hypothetical protein